MAKVRKIGYFWVQIIPDKVPEWSSIEENTPIVAKWDGNKWNFIGVEVGLDHDCVKVLSKCFNPPPGPNDKSKNTSTAD